MKKIRQTKAGTSLLFKFDLKMRLSIVCLLIPLLGMQAKTSYAQKVVSLDYGEISISDLLDTLESKSDYRFVYKVKDVDLDRKLSVSANREEVENLVTRIFKESDVNPQFFGDQIFLNKKLKSDNFVSEDLVTGQQDPIKISGTVTDDNGVPLPGVNITIEGTSKGTSTDFDGNYEIEAEEGQKLVFSSVGFEDQKIQIEDEAVLNIKMREGSALEEVVVTALGIKRKARDLGYAEETITAKDLSAAPSSDWASGLHGKVAGLKITNGSTGPINSGKIQLRGTSSLNLGKNGALIVIDGVPMNQEAIDYGDNVGAAYGSEAPVDYGNAISELDQNDIENVSILKGPSAAALYGSRAANGVVIITTKSGQKNQKIGVTFNSTLTLNSVINWPNYQYEYGAGGIGLRNSDGDFYYSFGDSEDGPSTNTPEAFGPKFEGQYYYQYDPDTQEQGTERTLWRPYKNNRRDLYRTGITKRNSIVIQGGSDKGSARLGFTHEDNEYILPNTGFDRIGVSFNGSYDISERIKLQSTFNYNNRNSGNLPGFGISNGSIGYFEMFLMPSVDLNWYKPIWQKGKENLEQLNPFSNWSSNPYYLLYVNTNSLKSHQIIGSTKVDVEITDRLSMSGRLSLNSLTQLREQRRGFSDKKHANGYYGRQDLASREVNAEVMFNYKEKIGDKFQYNIMAGANRMSYSLTNLMSTVDQLSTPDVYKLANSVNVPQVQSRDAKEEMNSVFGQLSLSWEDNIFVDVTGRNDWSSTLPAGNNSYFYPSVSSSFILSDLLNISGPFDFIKYRLSYAQVGNAATPYQTELYYNQSKFPNSATVPTSLFNAGLKPEITSSWETGFELRFLAGRIGTDITVYSALTKNQILSLPTDIVTGYQQRTLNAGNVKNTGVELALNTTPILTKDFKWDINANWTTNKNEIKKLTSGLEKQTLSTVWKAAFIAKEGGSVNDLWGKRFLRDPDGEIVHKNGVPEISDVDEFYGNTNPDWVAGITNILTYKNFRLGFTFDGQYGGLIWSGTYQRASWAGTTPNTLRGRDEGVIIGEGVMEQNGSYVPNDVAVNTEDYYVQYYNDAIDGGVFSSNFIKLREVSLGYTFKKGLVRKWGLQDLSINLFGRDLAVFSKYPMYDPEGGTKNGSGNVYISGAEIASQPLTASYGASIQVSF